MSTARIDRRTFSKRLMQLLICGGLTHFTLANSAYADTSQDEAYKKCPGGLRPTDICNPDPAQDDNCPGEMPPADECPPNGNTKEDRCNSGLAAADVCDPNIKERSDQCSSCAPADDLCPEDDKCYSGTPQDDYCPDTGGLAAGDACPGGGPAVDTCEPEGSGASGGDECPEGTWSLEDDCNDTTPDLCSTLNNGIEGMKDDDTCITGRNTPYSQGANGPDDWCLGDVIASDNCWSGKDEDDVCDTDGGNDGGYDECPTGSSELDRCGIVGVISAGMAQMPIYSDDYCVAGRDDSDACPSGTPPEDECVGGIPAEDICYMHTAGSDECDRNTAGSDQGGCKEWSDTCFVFDKCNVPAWSSQDIAE